MRSGEWLCQTRPTMSCIGHRSPGAHAAIVIYWNGVSHYNGLGRLEDPIIYIGYRGSYFPPNCITTMGANTTFTRAR